METQDSKDLIDSEWENRTLCKDGNCIGVIGIDGRCKVCGLPYEGELPLTTTGPTIEFPDESDTASDPEPQADSDHMPDEEWDNRVLCSDGNCIGVIGSDGRCKVCSKPYEK